MTGHFARGTEVAVERSKEEAKRLVIKYGATGYMVMDGSHFASICFNLHSRNVKIDIPIPDMQDREFTHYKANTKAETYKERTPEVAYKKWEGACRQKWRVLILLLKANLEAVENGAVKFDEAFMPYFMLADGQTVAEKFAPTIEKTIKTGKLPKLLGSGS